MDGNKIIAFLKNTELVVVVVTLEISIQTQFGEFCKADIALISMLGLTAVTMDNTLADRIQ